MMKTTDEIRKEIANLEEEREKLNKEQSEISEKIRTLELKLINLPWEGKYIKYVDTFDSTPIYMKVDWIRESPEKTRRSRQYSYTFKGFGFFGELTGYDDATQFEWSYWFEFDITGELKDIKQKIGKIEEITKEEFNAAFEYLLETVREYHYNKLNN